MQRGKNTSIVQYDQLVLSDMDGSISSNGDTAKQIPLGSLWHIFMHIFYPNS